MSTDKKRWSELSPVTRAVIVKLAVLDVGLKCWALADLVNRPPDQVEVSKAAWAIALTISSSAGVFPGTYLASARKSDRRNVDRSGRPGQWFALLGVGVRVDETSGHRVRLGVLG
jgi:hypothetical protein